MNRAEEIRNWASTHTTPDQELTPHLVQYWKSSKGTVYWDNRTGKRSNTVPYGNEIQQMSVKADYYGLYVKYISELEALEIASIHISGNRGVDGVPKRWEYGQFFYRAKPRLFIFKGTTTCYDANGNEYITNKKYNNETVIDLLRNMTGTMSNKKAEEEIRKLMGSLSDVTSKRFKNSSWHVPYYVKEWYEREFMPRTASSRTAFLLEYEVSDEVKISEVDDNIGNYLVFEKLDDDYALLRLFRADQRCHYNHQTYQYDYEFLGFEERVRCFISAKGKPTTAHKYGNDSWELSSSEFWGQGSATAIVNPDDFKEWKPLKYLMPILDKPTLTTIIQMLRHPIVEQIAKAGYPNVAKHLCYRNEIANNLKVVYGAEKEKKIPFFKLLGVNKWLMQKEDELFQDRNSSYRYGNSFIHDVKELYARFDISDLSKETVDILYKGYKASTFREIVGKSSGWRYNYFNNFTEEEREETLKACRREFKHEGWLATYKDCRNLLRRIDNAPDVELDKVDKMSDLIRIHDALIDIQIREQAEREARYNEQRRLELEKRQKEFEKKNEERIEMYDYEEENGDFVIRTPRRLDEITKEGIALHHCVGGYVNKHADGYTNILFLRKKSEIEHSFYTIEIANGRLIQIHGSCNKWLGNDPEAIPFVYRYLKQLGIQFDKNILLNKATGYGKSEDSLPESYLTAA